MNNTVLKFLVGVGLFIVAILTDATARFFDLSFAIVARRVITGNTGDIFLMVGIFAIYTIVISAGVYFLSTKEIFARKEKKKLGSSKMSTMKELSNITGQDGLILGKQVRLSMDHSFSHNCLIGVTGSGKSSSFFIPNLVSNPNVSFIVTDPKGELFEKTAKENLRQGKRVLVFSPFRENTLKYNPLSLCRTATEVRELAQTLLVNGNASAEAMTGSKGGGSEWINMSTPLLTAFLLFVKDLKAPKNTVSYALDLIINSNTEEMEYILEDNPLAMKQFRIFMQSAQSEQTASSIKTVLSTNLQIFADPVIENLTMINEISPEMLREKPTALYVVVPEQKSDFMAPLMSPFYSQMIGRLMEKQGVPVYMFLDEFANIGVINNIDKYLAVVRSRKISISIGIQSINQLKQRYGQDAAGTILDNLKTKCILPGSSFDTADYFSKMIGSEEIDSTSSSYNGRETSYSENKQRRELFSADEIRRLPDGKILILTDNKNPYMDKQERYYEKQEYIDKTADTVDIEKYIAYYRKKIMQ